MKPPTNHPSSDENSSTTTTTSSSEDISRDTDGESDDDEFVDAPEASGTLISKFLNQTARLSTVANAITNREDLTLSANWGGSPSNIDFETPPSYKSPSLIRSASQPSYPAISNPANADVASATSYLHSLAPKASEVPTAGESSTSTKTTTLRTATERARQSKLDETRRRLIRGEDEEEDDDDDDDEEIRLVDEEAEGGKLVAAGIRGSTRGSTSPSQTSTCSDAISLGKQSTSNAVSIQPFKVVEEQQDNISISRHSQYHVPRGQGPPVSVPSFEGGLQLGKPPDIISSCCNETSSTTTPSTSAAVGDVPQIGESSTALAAPPMTIETASIPPPVPPPRRKKKKIMSPPDEPRSKSPTVSIRSHIMMDTRNNISMYCSQLPSSSSNNTGMLVVTAQDEEKTKAKSTGPKVLRRTESLGLVGAINPSQGQGNQNSASTSLEKEAQQARIITENQNVRNIPTFPNSVKSTSLKSRRSTQVASKVPSVVPGSYSLPGPGPLSNNVKSEIKKYSLPILRTKTDSGKMLSDLEILEQVTVVNLDTGERIPLSAAEDKIPKCINPLTLHIMRLTSEYVSEDKQALDSDDDDNSSKVSTTTSEGFKRKRLQLKKLIGNVGRSALNKAKSFKSAAASSLTSKSIDEGETEASSSLPLPQPQIFPLHQATTQAHRQQIPPSSLKINSSNQLVPPINDATSVLTSSTSTLDNGPTILKMKASPKHKGPYDFENLELVQELAGATSENPMGVPDAVTTPSTPSNAPGPIWCMKFSNCGRLLAAAGQDKLIKVFVLKSQLNYFVDLIKTSKVSPTPSVESVNPSEQGSHVGDSEKENSEANQWPFVPLSTYAGHTADLLDITWSKSFFLLSSSMDRTVRLWHISRKECLCTFQHADFVTAIAFHPRDDRYFLSGSLDSKVRIWNIPDKKVALWNEVPGPNNLITTANFCQNGKFAVVGTYDGRVIFYHTEQLKYHTQIILNKKKCVKISGIEPMEDKILVTSNDSRIRLFDLRDLSLNCKYTGSVTRSSQIKASFSHDSKFIISGSENSFFYIWRTAHEYVGLRGGRRDRNKYWEGVKVHNAVVTCAIFSPDPDFIIKEMILSGNSRGTGPGSNATGPGTSTTTTTINPTESTRSNYSQLGYVIASADFNGKIKILICKIKPKCSSLPVSAIA